MIRAALALGTLGMLACGGGDCVPIRMTGGDLSVTLTPEGGCDGSTWRAEVVFPGGRTQTLAGDRDGAVVGLMIGDLSGDGADDLVVQVERGRLFAFIRQGTILFGRELPAAPGPGPVSLRQGQLRAGDAVWDVAAGAWRPAP